jgi:hypothetical protein
LYKLIFLVFFLLSSTVYSRPVSYTGGTTLMGMNNGDRVSSHIHYSPKYFYSIGYRFEYWKNKDYVNHFLQGNYLLKRFNEPASQANIYIKSGVGTSTYLEGTKDYNKSYFIGSSADWETQRLYANYAIRYTDVDKIEDFLLQSGAAGFAPYIGDYGDLHTWILYTFDYNKDKSKKKLSHGPKLRFFKSVNLLEIGINNNKELILNLIIRF